MFQRISFGNRHENDGNRRIYLGVHNNARKALKAESCVLENAAALGAAAEGCSGA